jgi:dihydroorotate dehydrogenase (fumarate)/dihydroorotate dehydrogenase
MSLYTAAMRPLLFALDAETAHQATVEACRWLGAVPPVRWVVRRCLQVDAPELLTEVAGLRFANPLGLAAGWDKSGRAAGFLGHLGLGFAEIGSVSARPSQGNPRPRLFRLPRDRAIVVNYGLPNDGVEVVARRLARVRSPAPIGVNLVKTNDGPAAPPCLADAVFEDYAVSLARIQPYCQYVSLNLSCPNAADGTDFFARPGRLRELLERLRDVGPTRPVVLKIAPERSPEVLGRLIEEALPFEFVRGWQFNLPMGKPAGLVTPGEVWRDWPGAVSGRPAAAVADECLRALYGLLPPGRFFVIGSGGVFTAEDAYRKLALGASLVQIYTALVYEGPGVVPRILQGLRQLLARDGFRHVAEVVGTAAR